MTIANRIERALSLRPMTVAELALCLSCSKSAIRQAIDSSERIVVVGAEKFVSYGSEFAAIYRAEVSEDFPRSWGSGHPWNIYAVRTNDRQAA